MDEWITGSDVITGVLMLIVLAGLLRLIWYVNYRNPPNPSMESNVEEARRHYRESLDALKKSPTDTELRQLALRWGREYARRSRTAGLETVFDEIALMNDLHAVTGGKFESVKHGNSSSVRERLRTLEELRKEGLISDEEYKTRREVILNET